MPIEETESLFGEEDARAFFKPLRCDRWIARSCLQKAIRRADSELAVRALANLFLHDPKLIWRHMTIIALEDVGLADVGILTRINLAKLQASRQGGVLWTKFVDLTERS